MERVLRSATKKNQNSKVSSSKKYISKKQNITNKSDKKVEEIKNKGKKQSDIWNINSILSNIFSYIHPKDLVEFSTVCKKWNHVMNPTIYKTINLARDSDIIWQLYGEDFNRNAMYDAEITECISHNTKYAHLVSEFTYIETVEPRNAIRFFQTFKFITSLTIRNCDMSQDQFLGMISPLTQLQELVIRDLKIKRIVRKRLYKEVVQLPPTLKKLKVNNIELINNPELFIQTMNSHNNLIDFYMKSKSSQDLLEGFHKHCPSLLNFEFYGQGPELPQSLFTIFENNTQLISLKLSLECWNSELVSHINSCLTNLEELSIYDCVAYFQTYTNFSAKFSQSTKIKKLNLELRRLTGCSLNSILQNCPGLEELNLIPPMHYNKTNHEYFFNLSNPTKLKKLFIECRNLGDRAIDNLLSQCVNLNELNIILSYKWKEVIKSICEKCAKLERLTICPDIDIYLRRSHPFYREFYENEFFTSNPIFKSTLTHLTLKRFEVTDSNAEYFKSFENLKYIKYIETISNTHDNDMDLFPGYRLMY
jgi:hypothetical protein